MKFTAIILAGGKSRRMGINKALVLYLGRPLITYSIDLAKMFTSDILISANSDDLDCLGFPVLKDELKVNTPLAGIHAGIKASQTDWNLILTCDMPNVTHSLIRYLIAGLDENVQQVLPAHDTFIEPLCGFYNRRLIPLIESNIKKRKLSPRQLFKVAPHRIIPVDHLPGKDMATLFKNMNSQEDLV
ncbi:MAG: molybdenum cofactor guanylyltransferase [Bacteroidota bacterium]